MRKKILIIGGAGFIGSNLAHKLLRDGQEVLVWDNLSTGSKKNIKSLESNRGFTLETKKTIGEVVNLDNPEEYTMLELAKIIKLLTKSSSEIVKKEPLLIDDPLKRRPDISKARELLGW